jgi:hypothetical protein
MKQQRDPVVLDHQRHGHVVTLVEPEPMSALGMVAQLLSQPLPYCSTCGRGVSRVLDSDDWIHLS